MTLEDAPLLLVVTLANAGDSGSWLADYAVGIPLRVVTVHERTVEHEVRELVRDCPRGVAAAVTIDQRFMGFLAKRAIDTLTELAVPLPTLIHPTAQLASGVSLGAGVRVGPGAVIGEASVLGDHVRVLERAVVGRCCTIDAFSTVDPAVVLGNGARLGRHGWLRSGVILEPHTQVGPACELNLPGVYRGMIVEGTQQMPGLDGPARILRFG